MPGLILIAPAAGDDAARMEQLRSALADTSPGHGIDAVLIGAGMDETETAASAPDLVRLVQDRGAAAIIVNHTRTAGRTGADGVHIETGLADIQAAIRAFKPDRIVGAGNLKTRHAAMEAGSEDIDYVLFGRLHGDTHPDPHPKALDLAQWWAELMQVPVVLAAGNSIETLRHVPPGIDFVALNRAVWDHPRGPAFAVKSAQAILSSVPKQAT